MKYFIINFRDLCVRGLQGDHHLPTKNKMNTKIEKRLHKVKQRITRYECQRTRYLHRRGETAMQFRKARTRTLIQLGGLVEKSGILEPLNITPGDDLQKDYEHLESAAILTGALSELQGRFYDEEVAAQKVLWLARGREVLS